MHPRHKESKDIKANKSENSGFIHNTIGKLPENSIHKLEKAKIRVFLFLN